MQKTNWTTTARKKICNDKWATRKENRSSNFQSIIHKQKECRKWTMQWSWRRTFRVVVNRHLLLLFFCFVFNSPSPLPCWFVIFSGFSSRILIPVILFFSSFSLVWAFVVLLAILRALLFLWFPAKHGDLAVLLYMCGDFFFYRTGIIIVFISIKIHREGKRNKIKCGKSLFLIMQTPFNFYSVTCRNWCD